MPGQRYVEEIGWAAILATNTLGMCNMHASAKCKKAVHSAFETQQKQHVYQWHHKKNLYHSRIKTKNKKTQIPPSKRTADVLAL